MSNFSSIAKLEEYLEALVEKYVDVHLVNVQCKCKLVQLLNLFSAQTVENSIVGSRRCWPQSHRYKSVAVPVGLRMPGNISQYQNPDCDLPKTFNISS